MAKLPKQQSLLYIAITGNWIVSATFTVILFIIIYIVIPSVTNPILKPMALALRSFGLFLMAIFGLMALVKFIRQSEPKKQFNWATEPNASNEDFKKAFDATLVAVSDSPSLERTSVLIPTAWTLKLIQDIEWKKFEELSTAYYQEKGIRAEATSLGADGGIDIKLYQDSSGNPTSLVQCKAWISRQVGVKEIREFLGVMTHEKIAKGFYMTSGEYSTDAKGTATAKKLL